MQEEEILNFIAELGQLKRVKRSGWWVAGISDPESVADHSFRTAAVGHVLASMEEADPYKVVLMCLYNDIHEARINDLHKIGHRYIDFQQAEEKVQTDQLDSSLSFKRVIAGLLRELIEQKTPESHVARDADILECIVQGKEYYETGYRQTEEWFTGKREYLHTESARKLFDYIEKWSTTRWRDNLRKFER